MSIFGNYLKEGPGVSKNERPKKRLFVFFDILKEKYWNLILLTLIYLVCCLPIVTIGAATGGFIYVLRNFSSSQPTMIKSDFFDAFKKNWKQSTIIFLLNFIFFSMSSFSVFLYYNAYSNSKEIFYFIGMVIVLSAMVLAIFMNFYIHIMVVTFDFSMKKLLKNSFLFAGLGLKANFLNLLILLMFSAINIIVFLYVHPVFMILFLVLITIPFVSFACVFNAFPNIRKHIIDPYYTENNIKNPLDKYKSKENTDAIFNDEIKGAK